jgi:phosphatidate cytidylyltransferase
LTNLGTRVAVAVVGIPLILLVSWWGGLAFLLFILIASSAALWEFYRLSVTKGVQPQNGFGVLAGGAVILSFYHTKLQGFLSSVAETFALSLPFPSQWQLLSIVLILASAAACLFELFRNKGSPFANLGTTLVGVLYVSLFFGTLVGIRELFHPFHLPMSRYFSLSDSGFMDPQMIQTVDQWGGYTVISLLACIWICDTAAYFAGLWVGTHKLFPRVSPNKTWEGTIAGFIAAVAALVGAKALVLEYMTVGQAVVVGIIVGIFGQLGDLVESLFKRDAGVKDSSSLIPGHGGVFDRFDSLIFVSPLVYLYLDFIVFS